MSMPTQHPDEGTRRSFNGNLLARFFGGPPLSVIFRLVLRSILIGGILKVLGLDPFKNKRSHNDQLRAVRNMGFDAVLWLWRYFLLGAVIVIPIWLIMRLMSAAKGR